MLGQQYLMYGEWLYAKHSIFYRNLPHYFFEFDIFDKQEQVFLDLERRLEILRGIGVQTVPVLHQGSANLESLQAQRR